jgi:hypothetical protein
MKIRELIAALSNLDSDLEVVAYLRDGQTGVVDNVLTCSAGYAPKGTPPQALPERFVLLAANPIPSTKYTRCTDIRHIGGCTCGA